MKLEGSCHCGNVTFSVDCPYPYPFNFCYCAICRKTAGGGGFAINLGGEYDTLAVNGKEFISVYRAKISAPDTGELVESPAERSFCRACASALWVWDPRWPGLVHPFASVIDTGLPVAPERTHLMFASKAAWVEADVKDGDRSSPEYPEESLAQWHERLGLVS